LAGPEKTGPAAGLFFTPRLKPEVKLKKIAETVKNIKALS